MPRQCAHDGADDRKVGAACDAVRSGLAVSPLLLHCLTSFLAGSEPSAEHHTIGFLDPGAVWRPALPIRYVFAVAVRRALRMTMPHA
jgi:hypothetical protein